MVFLKVIFLFYEEFWIPLHLFLFDKIWLSVVNGSIYLWYVWFKETMVLYNFFFLPCGSFCVL